MKWLSKTNLAQSHCSLAEGIFCCTNCQYSNHCAIATLGRSRTYILNLELIESRYRIDDYPRQTSPKVHQLMHEEAHDSRGEDVVANERIPRRPQALKIVKLDIIF